MCANNVSQKYQLLMKRYISDFSIPTKVIGTGENMHMAHMFLSAYKIF